MFEVIKAFRDAKNDNYFYGVGDTYPVSGYKPTKVRIEELAKGKNKFGVAFLKEISTDNGEGETNPSEGQTPDPNNGEGESKE